VPLSDVLPILADMGLKTLEEWGHALKPAGDAEIHVHEFLLEDPRGGDLSFGTVKDPFEAAFAAVWNGRTESDGFNRLVLELGVGWRDAALIRTLARYRQQTGSTRRRRCRKRPCATIRRGPRHPGPVRRQIRPGLGR
jgi:glutamate dehydrogenase